MTSSSSRAVGGTRGASDTGGAHCGACPPWGRVCAPPLVVPGATTSDDALVATTVYRDTNAQGPLLGEKVNNPSEWFGPFANDVADNRVTTSLSGVFDTSVVGPSGPVELDPAWRGNRGRVFHFDPAFEGHFGTPLSVYGQPQGLSLDGDLPLLSSVGPYR
jgi:hypothetical protein